MIYINIEKLSAWLYQFWETLYRRHQMNINSYIAVEYIV